MKLSIPKIIVSSMLAIFVSTAAMAEKYKAVAVLIPTEGNAVSGVITFTQKSEEIKVTGDIKGLKPGEHGFHIHEYGDCSASDGSSAGGHFNPLHKSHGSPMASNRHVGDLGNISADDKGEARFDELDKMIAFKGQDNIIGRSVIIHTDKDDLTTQPTGNAGGRVACGVIGIAKP